MLQSRLKTQRPLALGVILHAQRAIAATAERIMAEQLRESSLPLGRALHA